MAINVIVTGFYSSGSSAVIDFLKDLDNVVVCDLDEVRFLQDPFGVSDLEYNLVENPHRHNSSQSIKYFLRVVDKLQPAHKKRGPYFSMFHGQFRKLSYDYANSLINFSFNGYNHNDINTLGPFNLLSYKLRRKIIVLLTKDVRHNFYPKLVDYCSWPSEDYFLDKTNEYLNSLSVAANPCSKGIVVFDQLFPSSNLDRYIRYFLSSKTILVNRDPRDVYLCSTKEIRDHVIPTKDINQFCEWYDNTRKQNAHIDTTSIMEIDFESLVLDFNKTAQKICEFLNIPFDLHRHVFNHFQPGVSKHNVNQKLKYKDNENEIKIIEEKLKNYLYNFEYDKQ